MQAVDLFGSNPLEDVLEPHLPASADVAGVRRRVRVAELRQMVSAGPRRVARPADLRIGRIVAWTAGVTSLLGVVAAACSCRPIARLIALSSRGATQQKEACRGVGDTVRRHQSHPGATRCRLGRRRLAGRSCIACLVVCWSPRRWWTPQDASGASEAARRVLAARVAARARRRRGGDQRLARDLGLGRRIALLRTPTTCGERRSGVAAIVLASVCIAVTAALDPRAPHALLAHTPGFWLLPVERRRRSGERVRRAAPEAGVGAAPASAARPASDVAAVR